jgi:hypothetical protein
MMSFNLLALGLGEVGMLRQFASIILLAIGLLMVGSASAIAQQPQAYGQAWGNNQGGRDFARFQHYPYVYYPQNFYGSEYYRSSDSLYHRYPTEMQIPVYNRKWENYYPKEQRYHWGHHFILDVF